MVPYYLTNQPFTTKPRLILGCSSDKTLDRQSTSMGNNKVIRQYNHMRYNIGEESCIRYDGHTYHYRRTRFRDVVKSAKLPSLSAGDGGRF